MEKNITESVREFLGYPGKMISGSKSGYRSLFPDNLVVFNSNVIVVTNDSVSKVWYGDIDITVDRDKLKKMATDLGVVIYVLYEMDGRFENENTPDIGRYVYRVDSNGKEELGESIIKYYDVNTNGIKRKQPNTE